MADGHQLDPTAEPYRVNPRTRPFRRQTSTSDSQPPPYIPSFQLPPNIPPFQPPFDCYSQSPPSSRYPPYPHLVAISQYPPSNIYSPHLNPQVPPYGLYAQRPNPPYQMSVPPRSYQFPRLSQGIPVTSSSFQRPQNPQPFYSQTPNPTAPGPLPQSSQHIPISPQQISTQSSATPIPHPLLDPSSHFYREPIEKSTIRQPRVDKSTSLSDGKINLVFTAEEYNSFQRESLSLNPSLPAAVSEVCSVGKYNDPAVALAVFQVHRKLVHQNMLRAHALSWDCSNSSIAFPHTEGTPLFELFESKSPLNSKEVLKQIHSFVICLFTNNYTSFLSDWANMIFVEKNQCFFKLGSIKPNEGDNRVEDMLKDISYLTDIVKFFLPDREFFMPDKGENLAFLWGYYDRLNSFSVTEESFAGHPKNGFGLSFTGPTSKAAPRKVTLASLVPDGFSKDTVTQGDRKAARRATAAVKAKLGGHTGNS